MDAGLERRARVHAALGEPARLAIVDRLVPGDASPGELGQELGIRADGLRCVLPDFAYRAVDASGIVENEVCPVWVGRLVPAPLTPDPAEVMDWTWVQWSDLAELAERAPSLLSPWSVLQVTAMSRMAEPLELLA